MNDMERLTRKITNIETGGVLAYTLESRRDELKAYRKLGELEDLAEQGRLIILPCKVGDTFWEINTTLSEPCAYSRVAHSLQHVVYCMDRLGKTTFLTREEAEAALEKMKGEEHE